MKNGLSKNISMQVASEPQNKNTGDEKAIEIVIL